MNSADPGKPRAAQQVREYRLCLIVCSVCYCDSCDFSLLHQRSEKFVARPPPSIFDIQFLALRSRRDVHALDKKFQPVLLRQLRDESLISVCRPGSQQMIQVHDANHDANFRLQLEQQTQQRHGVRSARNRNAHAIARAKKRLVVHSALDRAKQRLRQF
jgi:hypothetical protein